MTMIVSAIAAGMAYTARTETLSSQSYTTMTHARYGAESGLAAATNYLLSTPVRRTLAPGTATDPLTNYNTGFAPSPRHRRRRVGLQSGVPLKRRVSRATPGLELSGQRRRHGISARRRTARWRWATAR